MPPKFPYPSDAALQSSVDEKGSDKPVGTRSVQAV
ncbi:hypothetical protein Pla52o_45760 [Novipirellula galeiformis]|uniref:Uncharacterized protein n=1 Tax=Novipirellula galeiformis TaxID=2528004 RepID=A0A5C6C9U3_9BACT|nr:hypothetical protein Pla52o_45760 [Novipirellula galeiformis]